MIDRLERVGFVVRASDPTDRRRVVVELQLERARSQVPPVFQPVVRGWCELMAGYDERDLRLIADFLEQVEQAIDGDIRRYRDR